MLIEELKNIIHSADFATAKLDAASVNDWFTALDIDYAIGAIEQQFLDERLISDFLAVNPISAYRQGQKIGIVCAGNLPLVGFGDMFYALLAGCEVWLKTSTRDVLMRQFAPLVHICDSVDELNAVDEIWAMGSDETCAILRNKFAGKRLLLRASRHSIAILDGSETAAELGGLADDIFLYCNRGCRSVSHIYIPTGYDIEKLHFKARAMPLIWSENYIYAKAVAIMRGEAFIDCGFFLLKNSTASDIATVGYSFYNEAADIVVDKSKLQCIVGHGYTPLGNAQRPTLFDFADGVSPL